MSTKCISKAIGHSVLFQASTVVNSDAKPKRNSSLICSGDLGSSDASTEFTVTILLSTPVQVASLQIICFHCRLASTFPILLGLCTSVCVFASVLFLRSQSDSYFITQSKNAEPVLLGEKTFKEGKRTEGNGDMAANMLCKNADTPV